MEKIKLQREINIWKHGQPFLVEYVSTLENESDNQTFVYNTYKISILLSDGLVAVMNDQIIGGQRGQILFFRPDEIHFGRFLRSGLHEYISFYIPTDFFDKLLNKAELIYFFEDRSKERVNFVFPTEDAQKNLIKIAKKTVVLLEKEELDSCEFLSIIMQICLLCRDSYLPQKGKGISACAPPYVSRTLSYINEHFREKISLEHLAKEMKCSVAYLSRVFKSHVGVTVYRHITDVRIGNAAAMLKNGSSVTEACFDSGFNDCSNFIRTFKQVFGVTPKDYKMG